MCRMEPTSQSCSRAATICVSSAPSNSVLRTLQRWERRLHARSIKVIVYDEQIPLRYYTIDFIHLTREGHAMIAAALLTLVMAILESRGAVNERSTLAGPRRRG